MPAKSDNLLGAFIVGRLLAESAGLGSSQATQWGAVLMATGLSPASLLMVSELARLDAMRLSEQVDHQTQLRAMLQQALQKAEEAAEDAARAANRTEQIVTKIDEINERMAKLTAWADSQRCSRKKRRFTYSFLRWIVRSLQKLGQARFTRSQSNLVREDESWIRHSGS